MSVFSAPSPRSDVLAANRERLWASFPARGVLDGPPRLPAPAFLLSQRQTVKRWPWLLLSIPLAVEQCFQVPPSLANDSSVCVLNGQVSTPPAPAAPGTEAPPQAAPLTSPSPAPPRVLLLLGLLLTCSSRLRLELTPWWCCGEREAGWGGGERWSSVSPSVVTIYCIFYLFSVTVLLIYQMVQMF